MLLCVEISNAESVSRREKNDEGERTDRTGYRLHENLANNRLFVGRYDK